MAGKIRSTGAVPFAEGHWQLAPEVFMRIVANRKNSEKHLGRIEKYAPTTGTVRILRLTEK